MGVVLAAGLYLAGLGVALLARPARASRFLMGHASSAPLHYLEVGVRIVVGLAFVRNAPGMMAPGVFRVVRLGAGGHVGGAAAGALAMAPPHRRPIGAAGAALHSAARHRRRCSPAPACCWRRWRRPAEPSAHRRRPSRRPERRRRLRLPALERAAEVGGVGVAQRVGDFLDREAALAQVRQRQRVAHVLEQRLVRGALLFQPPVQRARRQVQQARGDRQRREAGLFFQHQPLHARGQRGVGGELVEFALADGGGLAERHRVGGAQRRVQQRQRQAEAGPGLAVAHRAAQHFARERGVAGRFERERHGADAAGAQRDHFQRVLQAQQHGLDHGPADFAQRAGFGEAQPRVAGACTPATPPPAAGAAGCSARTGRWPRAGVPLLSTASPTTPWVAGASCSPTNRPSAGSRDSRSASSTSRSKRRRACAAPDRRASASARPAGASHCPGATPRRCSWPATCCR